MVGLILSSLVLFYFSKFNLLFDHVDDSFGKIHDREFFSEIYGNGS